MVTSICAGNPRTADTHLVTGGVFRSSDHKPGNRELLGLLGKYVDWISQVLQSEIRMFERAFTTSFLYVQRPFTPVRKMWCLWKQNLAIYVHNPPHTQNCCSLAKWYVAMSNLVFHSHEGHILKSVIQAPVLESH